MASCRGFMDMPSVYGSPPQEDGRIRELENRVQQLEDLVDRLMKSNKPSFMDFKFIKEEERKIENNRRTLERLRMLTR